MAILYGTTEYNCGKYQALGWDFECDQKEVWTQSPDPVAGSDVDPVPEPPEPIPV